MKIKNIKSRKSKNEEEGHVRSRISGFTKMLSSFVLTAILVTGVFAAVASATTIYVPEEGNQTIQQAVNNATAGDTIIVRDGTYNENIDVTVAYLTIQSENGSANCIVNASNSNDYVFDVQQNYVNISGFTVENATEVWKAGIYLYDREHCNISDNNVTNNNYGIYLNSSSNNMLTNNTASNNDQGISLNNADNNMLTNNTASDNGNGIHLLSSSNNMLTNNTVNSNNGCGIYSQASSDNTLTNNTASDNNDGIYLHSSSSNMLTNNTANSNNKWGILLKWSSSNNMLTNNTANSNNNDGIYLHSSCNYNSLTENTANSNSRHGIWLYSSSNNNVSCNWVQNNSVNGFRLYDGSTGNTIENNNIIANGAYNALTGGYEYQFYNDQQDDVEAKDNYWGAGMTNDTIDASIYDWQDDPSKGNVTFYKRDGPSPCAPIPELPTIVLFCVGLLALVGYVGYNRRIKKE